MPYDVVSFGETMLRLSPAPGVRLEQATVLHSYVAGTESNTLACLSRLGMRCAWLSALPDSPQGRRIVAELRGHGVDVSHVVRGGSWSRLGIFYAENCPDPVGTTVYYDRARSACAELDPASIDLSVLAGARLLHLTGVTPALGQGARRTFERLLHSALERGVPVSFDLNYRAKLWSAREAALALEEACGASSLLFSTREDAAELWGLAGAPEEVLRQMAARFGDKTIVLTLGADGAAQLRGGKVSFAPSYPSSGNVRFGSGDAFAAGYLYAYLGGEGYVRAARELGIGELHFGNALAALKRGIEGDIAVVTAEEVLAVLRGPTNARFR